MTVRRRRRAARPMRGADHGFTLIELMIAVVLGAMITGVVAAAILTSLNVAKTTTDQVGDSGDAALISAFLIRDAQSSATVDPRTALRDSTLGVTTDPSAAAFAGCVQPVNFVVRFSWIDQTPQAPSRVVVYYLLDGATSQLTRRACKGGTVVDVLLAGHLSTAVAACATSCAASPTSVSLTLGGTGKRAPFAYTLKASIRADVQATPNSGNSASVPLVALATAGTATCPSLALNGTGTITVRGDVLADGSCGAAPIGGETTLWRATGGISAIAGINDPFVDRVPPAYACSAASNPATIGVSASRSTVTVYPQKVTISSGAVAFNPGRYVFCNGLEITGGQVTGTDVLLYIAGGTMLLTAAATADLTGRTTGVESNLLIWVASVGQAVQLNAGAYAGNLRGIVYVPKSTLQISSVNASNIAGIVAAGTTFAGAGKVRVGLPLPLLVATPATIPATEVGVSYANTALVATGGTAPYTWTATGLAGGLSMGTSGVISGTPTVSGAFAVVATVFDATGQASSFGYSLAVNPVLAAVWPVSIPNGEVGVPSPVVTPSATGGTLPYVWSATGLPAGLSIDASTGAISGTPTVAGTANIVVNVTDALNASAAKAYTMAVSPALVATWPASMPTSEVGVAYLLAAPSASGGTTPYVWSSTGLPAGLSLDSSTGIVSGTPTVAGTFTVTLGVADPMGSSLAKTYTLTVVTPLTVTWPEALPNGRVATAYTPTTPTAAGGLGPYTWSATGLPAGMSMSSSNGTIGGTPTTAGTYTVVGSVSDSLGARSTKSYTVTVAAAAVACPTTITGWQGEYFANITLAGVPTLCRDDADVNFDWGIGAPAPGLPVDFFSVRWTRTQTFAAGTYNFALGSDDGARLYIDNVLVLDRWVYQAYPSPQPAVQKTLTQGPHTLRVEYFEGDGSARATLVTTFLDNGVTATASVSGDQRNSGQENITLATTSPISAMTLTIKVAQTTGISYSSQNNPYGSSLVSSTNTTAGGFITYVFSLKAGKTIPIGSNVMAALYSGQGTLHLTNGDTWELSTTTASGAVTQTGTF